MPLTRLAVRRLLPALLALLGAFSAPGSAVAHGRAHFHETPVQSGAPVAALATSSVGRAGGSSTGVDGAEHAPLHHLSSGRPATQLQLIALPARLTWHGANVICCASAPAPTRIVAHTSPPLVAVGQPRAPPLG